MSFIKVKNKKGTSGNTSPSGYSSWLDYWEGKKGKKASGCETLSCSGSSDVGGHVIKSGQGGKEYIVPICYSCNNKPDGEEFKVWAGDLVSVT